MIHHTALEAPTPLERRRKPAGKAGPPEPGAPAPSRRRRGERRARRPAPAPAPGPRAGEPPAPPPAARGEATPAHAGGATAAGGTAPGTPPKSPLSPEVEAEAIERCVVPARMATAMGLGDVFGPAGWGKYLERIQRDAGGPTDPVERMLLEQIAIAHQRTAQLQAQAGAAVGTEAAKLFNAAAARMLGEFRQTALALNAYRVGAPARRRGPDAPAPDAPRGTTPSEVTRDGGP